MELHFTPEQEAQLAQIATRAGTNPEHLVRNAALRLLQDDAQFDLGAPDLPVLHLGTMTSLRRCETYDDVP